MKDRFVLISRWLLDCDINQAWQRIAAIRHWQAWWPNVGAVRVLDDSDDDTPRVGRSAWVDWKTRLGYGLRLRVTTTRRHAAWREARPSVKYGSSIKFASAALVS